MSVVSITISLLAVFPTETQTSLPGDIGPNPVTVPSQAELNGDFSQTRRFLDVGVDPPAQDRVACLLALGPTELVAQRRRRLADALAVFNAATHCKGRR